MEVYNFIGDVHGQYDALLKLIDQMPKGQIISCGDMIDRGPKSKECLEFFMEHGQAILGNHEHLLLDWISGPRYYDQGIWPESNGGMETIKSFGLDVRTVAGPWGSELKTYSWPLPRAERKNLISTKIIDWLSGLPLSIQKDGFVLTHAPLCRELSIEACFDLGQAASSDQCENCALWNVGDPVRREFFQIYGHISRPKPSVHKDGQGIFAVGIDTAKARILTGFSWPSREFYSVRF